MGLSIKIKDVKPLERMNILVLFEDGVSKMYDVNQLKEKFPIYKRLEDQELFGQVYVDCGGYSVAWNSEIDISECELYENGTKHVQNP